MGKSNTPSIFQNEKTNVGKSIAENLLSQNKLTVDEIVEPSASFTSSDMTKVRVTEFPSGTTFIVDETSNNVKIYEIHSTGSYDAKLPNGDIIQKSTNNHIVIVKNNMQIAIKGDSIEIIKGDKEVKVDGDLNIKVNGACVVDASTITLKTGDAASWKPNCFQTCLFAGLPHYTSIKLKGE